MTTRLIHTQYFIDQKTAYLMDLFSLTKPRLSSLVIFTCALGIMLAPGDISGLTLIISISATSALVAGACVINCYMEKDIDSLMERTKNRPLPSGRISPETALSLGTSLIISSLLILFFVINPLTCLLGLLAAISYIALYTPLKTKTSWALFAGAIPGAIPPLMGWTTVTNSIEGLGIILFSILFVWQLPHFLSISIYHAKDYNNAAIKTFPTQIGFRPTLHRIVIYTFLLLGISLAPYYQGIVTKDYLYSVTLLGGAFFGYSIYGYKIDVTSKSFLKWARGYFFGSLIYLPLVFILLLYFR